LVKNTGQGTLLWDKPGKVFGMRKPILLSILISLVISVHTTVCGAQETVNNLPTEPIKKPRVVYLKWGRTLLCDYVWRDGHTIFVVVRGKKFAVGYDPKEIDMERSFGAPPKGAAPSEITGISVAELYEKSGMDALVNQIAGLYLSGLAQHQAKLPPEFFHALQRAGRDAFEGTKMRKRVLEVMESRLDPEVAQEVLAWLLSPLGKKITALESIQFSPKTLQDLQVFGKQLQSNPPPQKRLALIRRLDTATAASDKNVEVALTILVQTATPMADAMWREKGMGVEEMRRQIDLRRPQWEENARKSTQIGLIYIYRNLTDKELERYVSFSESKTGTTYHKVAFEALMAALTDAAQDNGKSIAKILENRPLTQ
jgi:hypothetical protein